MIWNDEVLFLHVAKTGGISVTNYLLQNLRGDVAYTAEKPAKKDHGARFVKGRRHEMLIEAEAFFDRSARRLDDFRAIFAVMRNPYDLEVSRYHYLQKGHEVDRGPAQELALAGDFTTYLGKAPFFGWFPPKIDGYYRIGERVPDNLRVLSFEKLSDEISAKMGPWLLDDRRRLPRLNTSNHDHYTSYYDTESEALCYERHRWFFDLGFYTRLVY